MTKSISIAALVLLSSVAAAQPGPAIRPLGPVAATSTELFGPLVTVRHLKNGVLVNDVANRRLLHFDRDLAKAKVVADTTPATANAYSGRSAGLIAYRGDSSLFVDAQSLSMLVIDPAGEVARVMSVPRTQDAMVLGNANFGTPAFDGAGKLVYRGMPRMQMRPPPQAGGAAPGAGGGGGAVMVMPEMPDTAAVVRVDLESRQVDTVGFTKVPKIKMDIQRDENGNVRMSSLVNPLPLVDDWAVLSDGSIALVRGRDYHIDWIRPDGSRSSSPKMPFDWQRLTDEDKAAFIDSVKAARERMAANAPTPAVPGGAPTAGGAGGGTAGGGEQRITMEFRGGDGPMRGGRPAGGAPGAPGRMEMNFVPANELPDYKPPFLAGQVRSDRDGNLWIRTIPTKAIAGGLVYDVINSQGQLVERVQVPTGRVIVGFGEGGVVYLLAADGATRKLERASFR